MQQININELKPHPRNNEFFDDMSGEKWKEFLESIKTSGVIEPIVVTTDMVIVSGHQRVRACNELGIDSIMCEIKSYNDEDSVIKDLLETNIRQRGDIGGSAKKVGKRIKELERLYGIREGSLNEKGNNRIGEPNNSVDQITQSDLAMLYAEFKSNSISLYREYLDTQYLARMVILTKATGGRTKMKT